MRFFPRAARSRALVALCAAGLLAASGAAVSSSYADELDDKHDDVTEEIEQTEDELEELSAESRAALAALRTAEADLVEARDRLAEARVELAEAREFDRKMRVKLANSEAELMAANIRLVIGTTALGLQQDAFAEIVVAQAQSGSASLQATASLLDATTPEEFMMNLGAQDAALSHEINVYDDLEAAETALDAARLEVAEVTAEVAEDREAAADNLDKMRRLETEAEETAAAIEALVADRERAHADLAAAQAADEKKLAALEAEQAQLEQQLADRGTTNNGPVDGSGVLMYPVVGPITSPYGYRRHPIYGYWGMHDGVDFGAACGAPMYAATDGEVLSRTWSDVYGNRLVIDHGIRRGVGLASVYNHATRYVVSVGDDVERGQVVGYVGSTGWSTGCHLHFTVMVNGSHVNPMNWF